jgi:hypothetical protein
MCKLEVPGPGGGLFAMFPSMNRKQAGLWPCILMLLSCHNVLAQTTAGTISGTVVDASDALMPNVAVSLLSERTGETRQVLTSSTGDFLFAAIQPGVYTLTIAAEGFKEFRLVGITLTASQRLSLGNLKMALGVTVESVSVTQQGEVLSLESADTTGLVSDKQMDALAARGRDVMNVLRVLPGVNTIPMGQGGESGAGDSFSSSESLGGNVGSFTPTASGARLDWNSTTVDGQNGSSQSWPGLFASPISMAAISEVKLVSDNYTAEYGSNMGATIQLVSKSGTTDFHGSVYAFKRHEQFNANDFFNNRNGLPKPIYRFNTYGGGIGGPIYIPGHFNSDKSKLFFFFSEEDWRVKTPAARRQYTVPTQLERQGNFSQTIDQGGRLITIRDPMSNAPFPNNVIPASRIDANGQVLLGLNPLPNALDRNITRGAYNFEFQELIRMPKRLQLLVLDYRPTNNDAITITPRRMWVTLHGYNQLRAFNGPPILEAEHHYTSASAAVKWNHIFSPRLVNEIISGFSGDKQNGLSDQPGYFDPVDRSKVGFTLGQLFPQANPFNMIPQALYGGVPSAPDRTVDGRLPVKRSYERFQFTDNFSAVLNRHTLKFGFNFERNWATDGPSSPAWNGRFDFGRDVNNPFDTNWAFSNANLGYYLSYIESNAKSNYRAINAIVEWFAQDVWKATSKLTLNYGVRFMRSSPWHLQIGRGVMFDAQHYDPSRMSPLFRPALNAAGARVGQNPVTGELVPAPLIGAFVPGVGDAFSGIVYSTDPGYEDGFIAQQGVQVAPRFGFAYNVFANGNTVVRGGFGVTNQSSGGYDNYGAHLADVQPIILSPQIFYSNMDVLRQSTGYIFPGSDPSFEWDPKVPATYHYSFGIQQSLPLQMVLDVTYVGKQSRHLIQRQDLNTLPYGTRFLPQNADPSAPSRPLPDAFLRPYLGYSSLPHVENSGTANYNGLQVGLNRRFSHGVLFGVSYTWSKNMGYASSDFDFLPRYVDRRVWSYGPTFFDQTNMFVVNYVWTLPQASKLLPNPVIHYVFDDWEFSGVTNFSSGLPQGISLATTDGADITGGGDGVRTMLIGQPQLDEGERGFSRWFNTAAFARPPRGYAGYAPIRPYRGPGVNNWDLSFAKNFKIKSEARRLQFRAEMFNAFNHTQFQSVDGTARFDPAGQQVNGQFGQVTITRAPRVVQLSLQFQF